MGASKKTNFGFKSTYDGASSKKSCTCLYTHFSWYPSLRAFLPKRVFRSALPIITLCFISTACAPVLVGAAAGGVAGGGAYLAQRRGDDKLLIESVLMTFENDTKLQNLKLDVDAEDGVVKLYGFVPARQDEERALTAAGHVDGVKEVVSRITILPARL